MEDPGLLTWLLGPIDPARPHAVDATHAWHGRLMVLAWGVLIPIGVIAARFFKVLPRQRFPEEVDNRVWWRTHLIAQWSSLALMAAGLWLVWNATLALPSITGTRWLHGWLGWAVLALGLLQGISGLLRGSQGGPNDPRGRMRGDHYDMTPRRLLFERLHKTVGYGAMMLAMAAVLSGMWQANAPRWMWGVIPVWWALLIVLFVLFQRRGMVIDTYLAIWGPDPSHPGNNRIRALPDRRRHGGGNSGSTTL